MYFDYNFKDFYDWESELDISSLITIPTSQLNLMHEAGIARDFDSIATSEKWKFIWTLGQRYNNISVDNRTTVPSWS